MHAHMPISRYPPVTPPHAPKSLGAHATHPHAYPCAHEPPTCMPIRHMSPGPQATPPPACPCTQEPMYPCHLPHTTSMQDTHTHTNTHTRPTTHSWRNYLRLATSWMAESVGPLGTASSSPLSLCSEETCEQYVPEGSEPCMAHKSQISRKRLYAVDMERAVCYSTRCNRCNAS